MNGATINDLYEKYVSAGTGVITSQKVWYKTRVLKALRYNDIQTVQELLATTQHRFKSMYNIGDGALRIIDDFKEYILQLNVSELQTGDKSKEITLDKNKSTTIYYSLKNRNGELTGEYDDPGLAVSALYNDTENVYESVVKVTCVKTAVEIYSKSQF